MKYDFHAEPSQTEVHSRYLHWIIAYDMVLTNDKLKAQTNQPFKHTTNTTGMYRSFHWKNISRKLCIYVPCFIAPFLLSALLLTPLIPGDFGLSLTFPEFHLKDTFLHGCSKKECNVFSFWIYRYVYSTVKAGLLINDPTLNYSIKLPVSLNGLSRFLSLYNRNLYCL